MCWINCDVSYKSLCTEHVCHLPGYFTSAAGFNRYVWRNQEKKKIFLDVSSEENIISVSMVNSGRMPQLLRSCQSLYQTAITAVSSPLQTSERKCSKNAFFFFPLRFPDVVKIRFAFSGSVATQWSGSAFVCKRNKCQNSSPTPVKNLLFLSPWKLPFGLTIWCTALIWTRKIKAP